MKRAVGIASGAAGLLVALALAACGGIPGGPDVLGTDAGAGARDAAFGSTDGGPAPPADEREGLASASACFDGVDNDAYAGADCSDTMCATTAVCCVGLATEACCGAPAGVVEWPAGSPCADGPIEGCASAVAIGTPFGLPLPVIDEGAIVPNGEPTADSGLVLSRRVSPRTSIVGIAATIAAPLGCSACIDGVAVGLAEDALGDANVTPVVAVQVSGSRGEVSLVAGNAVIWRGPLADDLPHVYTLTTHPDGRVELDTNGDGLAEGTVTLALPAGALDVVLYGRTTNRGPDDHAARVLELQVAESGCDMPASLERGAPTLVAPIGAPFAGRAHAPSVYAREGEGAPGARLVFAAGGTIWMAHPDGGGTWSVPTGVQPALAPNASFPNLYADDPSLIAVDDHWVLFVTMRDPATQLRRIQMVSGGPGFAETFDPAGLADVVTPMPLDFVEMDGASAFVLGTEIILVARAIRMVDGARESEIVLLRGTATAALAGGGFTADESICGTGCTRDSLADMSAVAPTLHAPRHDVPGAFDQDEVAAPALVQTSDGVYRLYFAGRRGTRWSVGMLVSMDLGFFRDPVGTAILAGTGEGPDALGVTDPEPWLLPDRMMLLYTGTDGAQMRVLAAEQPLE